MAIELRRGDLQEVRLRLSASDGSHFIVDVDAKGFRFYADESSAGNSHSKPVVKTVDDIWDWVRGSGDRVALEDRAGIRRPKKIKKI